MKSTTTISTTVALAAIAAGVYMIVAGKKKSTNMGTNTTDPLGYRNNNPLNIRYVASNNWKGKLVPNTDGEFEQFTDMVYGYRAALFLFRKYISEGKNTVASLIAKWAPDNENDTAAYISTVCSYTGFLPGTVLKAGNKEQLCKLAYAMAIVENGTRIMPDMSEIEEGWSLL